MSEIITFLQKVDIFSLLREQEIEQIAPLLVPLSVDKNECLFQQGAEGKEMFIVRSGAVSTRIALPNGKEREIFEFNAGDFFGEMSILENEPRSATCITKTECDLLRLSQSDFFGLINRSPEIAIKMMHKMLNSTIMRLNKAGAFLSDMVHWGNEARRRAITDELTGCYNRRFLDDAFQDYFESAKNARRPLSLMMIDLDFFREINEHLGHQTGDQVILEVVTVFKRYLQEKDIIARYGGDEFTVLLPDANLSRACSMAESIRASVAELSTLRDRDIPRKKISLSMGVASYPESAADIIELRQRADKALYQAKEEGRDRIVRA